jgi:hypothetical protein
VLFHRYMKAFHSRIVLGSLCRIKSVYLVSAAMRPHFDIVALGSYYYSFNIPCIGTQQSGDGTLRHHVTDIIGGNLSSQQTMLAPLKLAVYSVQEWMRKEASGLQKLRRLTRSFKARISIIEIIAGI